MALTLDGTNGIVSSGSITTQSATGVIFSDSSSLPAASSPYVLKNRIINGDMVIDQRFAGASITPNNSYTLDRWVYASTQTSKGTVQQNAAAVTPPVGFSNYLGFTSSSSYAVTSTDSFSIRQYIEGYNVADLGWGTANAKTVTLSFWVRSSLTGTFGGSIVNYAGTRSYPFSYTISSANTWTFISVTIAGDTSGTWVGATNAGALDVIFGLGSGSTLSGTVNAWQTGAYIQPTSTVSVVGTNAATWYVTGVQLEIGSTATPFERRLYNQELANCQRYCLKYCGNTVLEDVNCNLIGFNGTTAYGTIFTVVPMRSSPSVTSGTLRLTDQANVPTVTSVVASGSSYSGPYNINAGVNVASGVVQFRPYQLQANNSTAAYLILSAEL
jgi:hypothetical protein